MTDKQNSLNELKPLEIDFSDDQIKSESVVGGSFFYIRSFGLVTFLLQEDRTFTLCIGHGNFHTGHTVKSFDRVQVFKEREVAENALRETEAATLEYFRRLSDETGL